MLGCERSPRSHPGQGYSVCVRTRSPDCVRFNHMHCTSSCLAADRTLASRLATDALESAIATRKPLPGLVHHSDRGIQYSSGEYVAILRKHEMVPSMSRPANPYDNASCESFIKTLKREEIYANQYHDLDHLRSNIEEFIERYYNQKRLHSALGYRSPEEF